MINFWLNDIFHSKWSSRDWVAPFTKWSQEVARLRKKSTHLTCNLFLRILLLTTLTCKLFNFYRFKLDHSFWASFIISIPKNPIWESSECSLKVWLLNEWIKIFLNYFSTRKGLFSNFELPISLVIFIFWDKKEFAITLNLLYLQGYDRSHF